MTGKPPQSKMSAWLHRIDCIVADLNIVLAVFAIGLAVVDLTFLGTERVIDRLPEMTRVVYLAAPATPGIPAGEQRFP